MMDGILILLDEFDTDRLLRILYNGQRPAKVHTMICVCGAMADLRQSPKAWNGWQILPNAKCPCCLQTPAPTRSSMDPVGARKRFEAELNTLLRESEV
jgi:hypothetical protein